MTFIPQESYSKKELIECGNGALFTKDGDGRLPSDQMLMFDEITSINDFIIKVINSIGRVFRLQRKS